MSKSGGKEKSLKANGCLNPNPHKVKAPHFQEATFFDPRDIVQVKYEMLRYALVEEATKLEAAKLFGMSRPTFYEAECAFAKYGLPGLLPKQRGPKGAHKLNDKVMCFIQTCIDKNPKVTAVRLARLIKQQFSVSIHPRSVERAIARKKKLK